MTVLSEAYGGEAM